MFHSQEAVSAAFYYAINVEMVGSPSPKSWSQMETTLSYWQASSSNWYETMNKCVFPCSSIYQKPRFQHQQWWSAWIISTHLERWAPTVWGEVGAQSKGQRNHDVFGKMIIAYMPWSKGVNHVVLFFFLIFSPGAGDPSVQRSTHTGPMHPTISLMIIPWCNEPAINIKSPDLWHCTKQSNHVGNFQWSRRIPPCLHMVYQQNSGWLWLVSPFPRLKLKPTAFYLGEKCIVTISLSCIDVNWSF